jgi:hypothetical protein
LPRPDACVKRALRWPLTGHRAGRGRPPRRRCEGRRAGRC